MSGVAANSTRLKKEVGEKVRRTVLGEDEFWAFCDESNFAWRSKTRSDSKRELLLDLPRVLTDARSAAGRLEMLAVDRNRTPRRPESGSIIAGHVLHEIERLKGV